MPKALTRQELEEFVAYLKVCTPLQLYEVWRKEHDAGRTVTATLATLELRARNSGRDATLRNAS